jgi:DNA-binding transcriptional LysR family regulator
MTAEPVTFDQLAVFMAIVETGSFSGAARKLSRAQSAVSYAIANLERLLEIELFDRTGRKPE